MYIDLTGPVFASQIVLYVGPGEMTAFQSIAYLLTIIPFFWVFSPAATDQWIRDAAPPSSDRPAVTLSDLTFYVSVLFLVLLFSAFIRAGVFPIFAKMERWTFNEQAGFLHHLVLQRGDFFCFWWGTMFAAERLRHARVDYRFVGLLVVLMVYMFLAGGRFSPFYRFCSLFILPWSAVFLLESRGVVSAGLISLRAWFSNRNVVAVGGGMSALTVALISFSLYWNLTQVRGFHGQAAETAFLERVIVQPSEMGWASYQRILVNGHWDPRSAFDFLFERPIVDGRSTTPQFLMSQTIGEPRATELTYTGFQFAGGFPEIFFEVFGPYLGWVFILGAGWVCAAVSGLIVRSVLRGEYLVTACAFLVLYGFYVMYIGGMLNFVTVATYWLKVALLAGAMIATVRFRTPGLLPWAVVSEERFLWYRRKQVRRPLPWKLGSWPGGPV